MPTIIEAADQTSDHAVEIFRAWQKCLPGYDWATAEVDRFDGLVLTDRNSSTSLHFKRTLCGYSGVGPGDAATLLSEAGFGDFDDLDRILSQKSHCTFHR